MLLIEWVILISASLAILSVIMFFIFFTSFLRTKGQLKIVKGNKPKKRRSQRKWRRDLKALDEQQSSSRKGFSLFLLLLIISVAVGGYTKFYQMTNMTEVDTNNIVSGYYLIEQTEAQLIKVSKDEGEEKQLSENIHTLAVRMASFSAKKGNDRASEEGQHLLNRYYARMGQFGVNLSSQNYQELATKAELMKDYMDDIVRVQKAQKALLDFYKINEASLSEKK